MIDQVLIEFVEKIKATFQQEIVSILFYGSRARADHRKNSDYDILLIL
jgi:predicted nucleotidyltransferase